MMFLCLRVWTVWGEACRPVIIQLCSGNTTQSPHQSGTDQRNQRLCVSAYESEWEGGWIQAGQCARASVCGCWSLCCASVSCLFRLMSATLCLTNNDKPTAALSLCLIITQIHTLSASYWHACTHAFPQSLTYRHTNELGNIHSLMYTSWAAPSWALQVSITLSRECSFVLTSIKAKSGIMLKYINYHWTESIFFYYYFSTKPWTCKQVFWYSVSTPNYSNCTL